MTALWFVLKNWKAFALVACVVFIFTLGYKLRAAQDAYEQVETLKRRLGALQITTANDAKRLAADSKTIAELERKAGETPPNTGACLDRDAARRVRAIR